MNISDLIVSFEGRNLCSKVKVLISVDKDYIMGLSKEVVELEIFGVMTRGELLEAARANNCDDVPETLRTGTKHDDTFVICGRVIDDAAETTPSNPVQTHSEEDTQS